MSQSATFIYKKKHLIDLYTYRCTASTGWIPSLTSNIFYCQVRKCNIKHFSTLWTHCCHQILCLLLADCLHVSLHFLGHCQMILKYHWQHHVWQLFNIKVCTYEKVYFEMHINSYCIVKVQRQIMKQPIFRNVRLTPRHNNINELNHSKGRLKELCFKWKHLCIVSLTLW